MVFLVHTVDVPSVCAVEILPRIAQQSGSRITAVDGGEHEGVERARRRFRSLPEGTYR